MAKSDLREVEDIFVAYRKENSSGIYIYKFT
ncbi:hypothetical protein BCM02_101559 [Paenibacillus methanolicus]|uniref:Uncharacterized protein n=1 Tax=Paenibacillus methanolicus TaxID=582686 RepID=A0A5S5CLP9_9BACL|nr:hypothetical protein BCM02_101559 [Paenibacillus methanolicus]